MAYLVAVALLRGINVGGRNILPMKALAEVFQEAGAEDVATYIQSGNVVFRAAAPEDVANRVHLGIAGQFGLKVPVVVRSAADIAKVVAMNPFVARVEPSWLHVMFLADAPSAELIARLDRNRSPEDEFEVIGREMYLHLPNGAGKTKLTNAYSDSVLKTVGTQRNWRTVVTLAGMMGVKVPV